MRMPQLLALSVGSFEDHREGLMIAL